MSTIDESYSAEIRNWLLGRIEKHPITDSIVVTQSQTLPIPILRWWIFEGKKYEGLGGPLAKNWQFIYHQIRILATTYNPSWRLINVVEGEIDWISSFFHSLTSAHPTFLSKVTHTGLTNEEKDALEGWMQWTAMEWGKYVERVGIPEGSEQTLPWSASNNVRVDISSFRRWAHAAKRSRWPLLRNVMAETFRCLLEPQELDQLPLPSDRAVLFELVCIVRVLKCLDFCPRAIRWLDLELNDNTIILSSGISCQFQYTVAKVLESSEFDNGIREAIVRHGVRIPKQCDALILFDPPRNGFVAMLLEIKSGTQSYDASLHQLKCYRSALRHSLRGPILIWGIVEQDPEYKDFNGEIQVLKEEFSKREMQDFWIFSSSQNISQIMNVLLNVEQYVKVG